MSGGWIVTPIRFDRGQDWLTDLPDLRARTRLGVRQARRRLTRLGLTANVSHDHTAAWDAIGGAR